MHQTYYISQINDSNYIISLIEKTRNIYMYLQAHVLLTDGLSTD